MYEPFMNCVNIPQGLASIPHVTAADNRLGWDEEYTALIAQSLATIWWANGATDLVVGDWGVFPMTDSPYETEYPVLEVRYALGRVAIVVLDGLEG